MTTMVATWDPVVEDVGSDALVDAGNGDAGNGPSGAGPAGNAEVVDAGDDACRPPVGGGWETLVEHARALGPDPAHADLDDDGLEVEVRRAAGAQAAATARLLDLVGEFVARDLWVSLGMVSPGQWLSWAIGMAPSTAREMVRVALALRTFTATAQRFARGELSYSKVRAITRCGEPALESLLLQYADNAPASQLERIVRSFRSLEDRVDPHDDRMVAVRHGDRHVTLTVRLPLEVGLEAVALVDRIVQRLDDEHQPTDAELPGAEDVPVDAAARLDSMSARRADAVVHGLRLAVDHLDADLSAAARTTLVLVGDVDATIDQLADRGPDIASPIELLADGGPDVATPIDRLADGLQGVPIPVMVGGRPGGSTSGADCPEGASAEAPGRGGATQARKPASGSQASTSQAASGSQGPVSQASARGSVTPEPKSQRSAPQPSGSPVRVARASMHQGSVGRGTVTLRTHSGGLVRLSRHAFRALSCDAQLRRVVTAGGTPVDVGRTQRLVTWRLREALRARDGTCRFPGCAATRHLHAHHVIHWADDGPTDMANLVLLCGAHHRFVHARDWIVETTSDGCGWTFRAPDATQALPSALRLEPPSTGASAEAARGHDPWALQPSGWDGARLDLDAALDIMWQELGRLSG